MIEVFDGSGVYKPIPRYMEEVKTNVTLINQNKELKDMEFYFQQTSCENFDELENWINNTLILDNKENWKVFTINKVQCEIEYV